MECKCCMDCSEIDRCKGKCDFRCNECSMNINKKENKYEIIK